MDPSRRCRCPEWTLQGVEVLIGCWRVPRMALVGVDPRPGPVVSLLVGLAWGWVGRFCRWLPLDWISGGRRPRLILSVVPFPSGGSSPDGQISGMGRGIAGWHLRSFGKDFLRGLPAIPSTSLRAITSRQGGRSGRPGLRRSSLVAGCFVHGAPSPRCDRASPGRWDGRQTRGGMWGFAPCDLRPLCGQQLQCIFIPAMLCHRSVLKLAHARNVYGSMPHAMLCTNLR